MDDWKYTFPPVSKNEWLQQIEKDLKGTSPDSLSAEWWHGEVVNPFHHKEDLPEPVVLPGDFFKQPPLFIEWIDASTHDKKEMHDQIMSALQWGAQSLIFAFQKNTLPDFKSLLEGVFSNLVDISLHLKADDLKDIISQEIPFDYILRIQRDAASSSGFLDPALAIQARKNPMRFVYDVSPGDQWFDGVANTFQLIQNDFHYYGTKTNRSDSYLDNCIIRYEADQSYLKQIIQIRAIQLVWANFYATLTNNHVVYSSPVECHIRHTGDPDPDKYLIKASSSSLAASLTGIQALCIHHAKGDGIPGYYERINRNIHHLLSLESQMYQGMDPLSGAYSIDYYTRKWAEEIMKRIQFDN